jgi:hypothetical protein
MGWEVVSEQVAREKASQCLRDTVLTASKLGAQARGRTSEELLNGIELEEAKSFVCASMADLTGTKCQETSTPDFPASNMKRPRSVPNGNSLAEQLHYFKRPRHCASVSDINRTTFEAYNYRNTAFPPLHTYLLGDDVLGSYSGNEPSDNEYACVKQAIRSAEQLKDDDSAFQRLIDRMLRGQ